MTDSANRPPAAKIQIIRYISSIPSSPVFGREVGGSFGDCAVPADCAVSVGCSVSAGCVTAFVIQALLCIGLDSILIITRCGKTYIYIFCRAVLNLQRGFLRQRTVDFRDYFRRAAALDLYGDRNGFRFRSESGEREQTQRDKRNSACQEKNDCFFQDKLTFLCFMVLQISGLTRRTRAYARCFRRTGR